MHGRIPWAIGFWRDPQFPDPRFCNPIAFADSEWDLAECRLVAHHLRAAKRADSCLGYSWCRFHCGIADEEIGDSDFSDGLWLWPEGLAHYVLEHAVRVPEDFLGHVRGVVIDGATVPEGATITLMDDRQLPTLRMTKSLV